MKMTAAMTELADALDLPRLPRRIECFDISNMQGTNPVASMVVFQDGKPAKKEYRRFTIKTVDGRQRLRHDARGHRAADSAAPPKPTKKTDGKWTTLPDLVIVDGGKGQLNAALDGLEEVGWTDQPIVGWPRRTRRSSCRALRFGHSAARFPGALPRAARA